MKNFAVILLLLPFVFCDVSHIIQTGQPHYQRIEEEITTPPPPPRPYAFGYAAGRFPGHIDRTHTEISDGSGVVKGSFSYVDPRFRVRTVDYVADQHGFHPILNTPQRTLPLDTPVVAAAKEHHNALYARIANAHQQSVHPQNPLPRKTVAVAKAEEKHYNLYQKIAEDHARIAAQREAERAATAVLEPIQQEHY